MKYLIKTIVALFVTFGVGSLAAQPVAPATANTDTGTPADQKAVSVETVAPQETVVLSPFEVTSTKDTGYQATETLAGTRIRTNLGDIAAAISVLDKEFISDIGATDNESLLQYTTNAEVAGTRGTYAGLGNGTSVNEANNLFNPDSANRVRGLASADEARDYYITDVPWDSFNVDRIDILRGPNSLLFGLGSPAGIVNATTNNAEFRDSGQVTGRTGSYGSMRGTFDINEQLIKNVLAIRLDGMWDDTNYEEQYAFQDQKRLYGTARFDPQLFKAPGFHTSIKVKFEKGDINADRPRIIPPNDSITPYWRPSAISASNPFGGMGMQAVNNPYDPWQTAGVVAGNGRGAIVAGTANYLPYLQDPLSQQQPYWMFDGSTGATLGVVGGYINGGIDSNGNPISISVALPGRNNAMEFSGIASLPQAAVGYNLPGNQYGQYRTMSLQNPSIFDFYDNLIDGPNASEWSHWNTHNIDITQTALDGRVGFDLTFDRQMFNRGGQLLLGGSPTLTMDIMRNGQDFYLSGANGETSQTNLNFGRPYVTGAGNNGGSSYTSDREVERASVFGELRASDFTQNSFLVKLLGRQVLNLVASQEKYFNENRSWQMYANSQAWDGYWNGNTGNTNPFTNRPPEAFIYLGGSVIGAASPNGLNIPGISSNISLQNSGVYVFDPTYKNYTVPYNNTWNVPSSLNLVFTGVPQAGQTTQLYQDSNPANLVGWNSNFQDNLVRYNNGLDDSLLTLAQKQQRDTHSYVGSYQAYLWNDAIIGTFGWRYDDVGTENVSASPVTNNRAELNIDPGVYSLPGYYQMIDKGHSFKGGLVFHLNDVLPANLLPINISGTFNDSSNFQVTSARVDLYGNPISNPTGKTKEYGLLLATKDNKISLRVTKFDTVINNGASTLGNAGGIGTIIQQGLRWRNVFLYQLGGYTLDTENEPSYRNTWTNAYPTETAAQAQAQEDAAITGWNNIQAYMQAHNFFSTWNFTPTQASVLTTRTQYLTNPAAYQPTFSSVAAYSAQAPQGFTVTSDTESTGYEFDVTANPLPNWRIALNGAETTAVQDNVGGTTLGGFVSYMTSQLYNADGSLTPAGMLPQYGGASNSIGASIYGPWLSSYTLLKLQEGSDVSELRKWRYNVTTNYTFDRGILKNVGIGGAYRWQAKVVIGYPVTSSGSFNLGAPYYGPSEGYLDLWTSYSFKVSKGIDWKIQLNVANVGSRNGLIPISIEPDGQTIAAARIKPVQEWYLTNTLSF